MFGPTASPMEYRYIISPNSFKNVRTSAGMTTAYLSSSQPANSPANSTPPTPSPIPRNFRLPMKMPTQHVMQMHKMVMMVIDMTYPEKV